MANSKNARPYSSRNTRRSTSARVRRSSATVRSNSIAQRIILPIIIIIMIVVIIATLCVFFLKDERLVKDKISELSSEYYEDYFYENLIHSEKFQKINDVNSVMEKYNVNGLSPISLNDLLLYDNQKNAEYIDYFTKYCDINSTYIKFYPDPPYEKTSYHTEYIYSCNF